MVQWVYTVVAEYSNHLAVQQKFTILSWIRRHYKIHKNLNPMKISTPTVMYMHKHTFKIDDTFTIILTGYRGMISTCSLSSSLVWLSHNNILCTNNYMHAYYSAIVHFIYKSYTNIKYQCGWWQYMLHFIQHLLWFVLVAVLPNFHTLSLYSTFHRNK